MFQMIDKLYAVKNEQPKVRDSYLDNVKFFLILCVVAGHFIGQVGLEKYNNLYKFLFIFHMPCFVFVSGYFAKGIVKNGRMQADRVLSIFWLFLLMKGVQYGIVKWFGSTSLFQTFSASETPWYLLALTVWYLLVPLLLQMKAKALLPISIIAALLIGYDVQVAKMYSASRIIVFLPFFILGLICSEENLQKFKNLKLKAVSFLLIAIVFVVFILNGQEFNSFQNVLYGASPYKTAFPKLSEWGCWYAGYGMLVHCCFPGQSCCSFQETRCFSQGSGKGRCKSTCSITGYGPY